MVLVAPLTDYDSSQSQHRNSAHLDGNRNVMERLDGLQCLRCLRSDSGSCSNISATSETCSVTTGARTGTATLTDTTDSLSATFQVAQAAAPTCDHITGSYVGSFSNKCSTVTTGTVILCWSTSTTPVSNGDGATCATGTPLANNGSTTISSSQTFNIIAGANGAQDSSVTTYVYTITTPTAEMNLSNGAVMQNGAVIK